MDNRTNFIIAYITTKDKEQAMTIGRALVEERLAACVNVIDNMTSIYHWEGKVNTDNETILIAKTSSDKFEALAARVKQLHSYACPCVLSIPITDGNGEYLAWLNENL